MNLDEKIADIETKLPGYTQQLIDKNRIRSTWGINWYSQPDDATYLETDKYKAAITKTEEHEWYDTGGRIQWTESLMVHYKPKEGTGKLESMQLEKIVTRHKAPTYQDKEHLWTYDFVGARYSGQDKFETWWADKQGNKGPCYEVDLETKTWREKK